MSIDELAGRARAALRAAPPVGDDAYRVYCDRLAAGLRAHWPAVAVANERDLAAARAAGMPATLVARLRLTTAHLDRMADLAGRVRAELSGIVPQSVPVSGAAQALQRIPRPLGVVLMVYEARPTVTFDGALLPVAVGNAVLLRGGKEMAETNGALAGVFAEALAAAGLPADLVTVLDDADRSLLRGLLKRPDLVDVLIPRGGPSLVDYCRASPVPTIASGGGVNHLYVHSSADLELAARITLDAKLPDPAGCTSVEMVLVDRHIAGDYLSALAQQVKRDCARLTIRLDPELPAPQGNDLIVEPLAPYDLGREFLDPIVAVLGVAGIDPAVQHIDTYGSGHTEGIVAGDRPAIERFTRAVDAAMIVVNGSLRLHDGPTLGLGSELAIATGRLHARGPVTLGALVTHCWVADAAGALRGSPSEI